MTDVSEKRGLRRDVRAAIRLAVQSGLPIWDAITPTDLWRVERPTGNGGSEILLESRKGGKAFVEMSHALEGQPEFVAARSLVLEVQPELSGWIGSAHHGRALDFGNVVAHLIARMQGACDDRPGDTLDGLLDELDTLLRTRSVGFSVVEPLQGVHVEPFSEELALGAGIVLRCLSDAEVEGFLSHDATVEGMAPLFGGLLVALEARFEAPLLLDVREMGTAPRSDALADALGALDSALCALHCFKAGSAGVVFQAIRSRQRALPGLDGTRLLPPLSSLATHYTLEHAELDDLERFAQHFFASQLPELRLAASRLRDAELRPWPRDAIVDAFVGIEALLNPSGAGELSFRIAMNYATLGLDDDSYTRYRRLRDLYKVRSKIVHGAKEADKYLVDGAYLAQGEIASKAKAVLRDVIKHIVGSPDLKDLNSLDDEVWEARYFPGT